MKITIFKHSMENILTLRGIKQKNKLPEKLGKFPIIGTVYEKAYQLSGML